MGQRDNFAGGFLLGSVLGGVIGGILGSVLANRANRSNAPLGGSEEEAIASLDSEENIELARRRLEEKIAQLNLVIDDVRHQLGNVNELGDRREVREENH
jgi:Na+/glutamate symporter